MNMKKIINKTKIDKKQTIRGLNKVVEIIDGIYKDKKSIKIFKYKITLSKKLY